MGKKNTSVAVGKVVITAKTVSQNINVSKSSENIFCKITPYPF